MGENIFLISHYLEDFETFLNDAKLMAVQTIPFVSVGAVLFRELSGERKFLLIKHKEKFGGHWDFPKGHSEVDEERKETAKREVLEETGLQINGFVLGFCEESVYYPRNFLYVRKSVFFFLAKAGAREEVKIAENELEDFAWLSFREAKKRLTYQRSKEILESAEAFIKR